MRLNSLLLSLPLALAAVNEPCYGPSGLAGVCVTKSACASSGGTTIAGACPSDAADVLCCSKKACQGASSACLWSSDCGGTSASNLCPGPGQMKCCSKAQPAFGGYGAPRVPAVGACKQVAVSGANAVIRQFPGRVREIGCVRECACPGGDSEHCCGKAIDFMIADGGGQATLSGVDIAEWVMNHASANKVMYVIWGQKIWNPSQDKVTAWKNWRTMKDRGTLTKNHWDHVHVSYN